MRLALMLSAFLSYASAAEIETVTLSDGRVLIGEVTPKGLHAATVCLVKPKGAVITIALDDVKSREPYVAPPAPPSVETTAKPAAAASPPPLPAAVLDHLRRIDQVAIAQKALDAAKAALEQSRHAALMTFLEQLDPTPLPLTITEKSTPDEIRTSQRLARLNEAVTKVTTAYRSASADSKSQPWFLLQLVRGLPVGDIAAYKHDRVAAALQSDPIFAY